MSNGYSLHIGLNAVDPAHYAGWDGKLKGCENDAKDMMAIAQYRNFNKSTLLLTKQATIRNATNEIKKAAEKLKSWYYPFMVDSEKRVHDKMNSTL